MYSSIHNCDNLPRDKITIKGKIDIKRRKISGSSVRARTSDYKNVKRNDTGRQKSTIDTRKNIAHSKPHTESTST